MGQSIQEWIMYSRRHPLKSLKGYGLLKQTINPIKFFKGCLPQILLGPSLNTLSHIILRRPLSRRY